MRVEGERMLIEIRDDGRGLDPQVLPSLGQRYLRSPGGASGLGLAIAHNVIAAHGGRLEIESAPGRGTRIRFSLPAAGALALGPLTLTSRFCVDERDPD